MMKSNQEEEAKAAPAVRTTTTLNNEAASRAIQHQQQEVQQTHHQEDAEKIQGAVEGTQQQQGNQQLGETAQATTSDIIQAYKSTLELELENIITCLESIINANKQKKGGVPQIDDDDNALFTAIDLMISNEDDYKTNVPPSREDTISKLFTKVSKMLNTLYNSVNNDDQVNNITKKPKLGNKQQESQAQRSNDVLEQLLSQQRKEKELANFKSDVANFKSVVMEHFLDFNDGKFFKTFEDVFDVDGEKFTPLSDIENTGVRVNPPQDSIFKRTSHITEYDAAADVFGKEIDESIGRSTISAKDNANKTTIFGQRKCSSSVSAHLMPHGATCARYWFAIVPWVLNPKATATQNMNGNAQLDWDVRQKCIFGYKKDDEILLQTNKTVKGRVGIKNFLTNRIRLLNQKLFDNEYPSLFIIPIFDASTVKEWRGEGYSAVVLVASDDLSAAENYKISGSTYVHENNFSFLATSEQLEDAINLLASFVKCFCDEMQYLHNRFKHNSIQKNQDEYNIWANKCKDKSVPIPKLKSTIEQVGNGFVAVRKVTFGNYNDYENNPAPDPILLLSKAGCNWMKRNYCHVLPGCSADNDDSINDDDDDDTAYLCTLEEEEEARGWSSRNRKPSTIEFPAIESATGTKNNTLNGNGINNMDTDELTDDEDKNE
jgi:hypothetical protein